MSQWTEVDRGEGSAAASGAPSRIDRVALDAGGHHQQAGSVSHRRGQRRKMRQDLRVRPVQILDDDQGRAGSAGVRRDCRRDCAFAAIARGVVHRVIERPPFAELRQIKKIIEEDQLIRRNDLLIDQTLDGRASPRAGAGESSSRLCSRLRIGS